MKTNPSLLLALALLPASAQAYLIRDCHTTAKWSSQVERVADINPGPADAVDEIFGFAQVHEHMIAYKGALYFQANDGKTGAELWRVVGGGAPQQVIDLVPGPGGSAPHAFAVQDGLLYFAATTAKTGEEIFRTDGTTVTLVAETEPGPGGAAISGLTPFKDAIYFTRGGDPVLGSVWRYMNGVAEEVAAISATPGWIEDYSTIARNYVVFKNRLYFVRNTPGNDNYQLWAFDGTSATKIKTLEGDSLTSRDFEIGVDTAAGQLYFGSVVPGEYPFDTDELWRYDGQNPPVKIKTFDWNAISYSQPNNFAMYKGRLHFTARDRLFRVEGDTVHEYPAAGNGVPHWPDHLSVFDAVDQLYLTGWYDDQWHDEPYFFDGIDASLIENIMPDAHQPYGGSFASPAVDVGNTLFFYAEDDTTGRELWRVMAKDGIPFIECDIVVAPIWVDKRLWVMDRPEVIVATWRVTAGREPELLGRKATSVQRNKEIRIPVLKIEAGREPVAPFALATMVYNRATGEVLDEGYDVIGAPAPELRKALSTSAAKLLKRQRPRAIESGPARRKEGATRPQPKG